MLPDLFSIGGLTIHSYGLMIAVGFLFAVLTGTMRAKKYGLSPSPVIDIAIIGGLFGFLGAKLLFVIVEFDDFLADPLSVLGTGGFVVYGGIITGVAAVIIYARVKKVPFLDYLDLLVPSVAIAQGFGRVGCFLAGCCYGKPTDSFIGVTFPAGSHAPSGISLYPTQLLMSSGDFIIAVTLILLYGKLKNKGDIGALYLILYSIGRFIVEFFRADERGEIALLSTSQFISIFTLAIGIGLLFFDKYLAKKRQTTE